MNKELIRDERFIKIYFDDYEIVIDVNDYLEWEKVLNHKDSILKIESTDWEWNRLTGELVFKSL